VLGILAVFSSLLLVGALVGMVALVVGAIHIVQRRGPNGMAWAGIALALLSIVLSIGLGALYFTGFKSVKQEWAQLAASEEAEPEFAGWIGREVPDFTVTTLDGGKLKPSDWRGRRVVLDFWATWCPPCRQEIPHFIQLAKEHPAAELLIIGVSSEDEKTLKAFVAKEGVNYAIVSTDDLPAPFDAIDAIPTTFFIDRNGLIQDVVVGYHDYDHLKELALADDLPAAVNEAPERQP
jgi:peroxiredoxin